MAYPDVELELQVFRLNVSGIRGDVRDIKSHVVCRERSAYFDGAEQRARCDRLQQLIDELDERLTALELRYCCRALAPLVSRKAS